MKNGLRWVGLFLFAGALVVGFTWLWVAYSLYSAVWTGQTEKNIAVLETLPKGAISAFRIEFPSKSARVALDKLTFRALVARNFAKDRQTHFAFVTIKLAPYLALVSENEVLANLLANLYFGHSEKSNQDIVGIGAASLAYFKHEASGLSAGEAATLAAIASRPQHRHELEKLRSRRNAILDALSKDGELDQTLRDKETLAPVFVE